MNKKVFKIIFVGVVFSWFGNTVAKDVADPEIKEEKNVISGCNLERTAVERGVKSSVRIIKGVAQLTRQTILESKRDEFGLFTECSSKPLWKGFTACKAYELWNLINNATILSASAIDELMEIIYKERCSELEHKGIPEIVTCWTKGERELKESDTCKKLYCFDNEACTASFIKTLHDRGLFKLFLNGFVGERKKDTSGNFQYSKGILFLVGDSLRLLLNTIKDAKDANNDESSIATTEKGKNSKKKVANAISSKSNAGALSLVVEKLNKLEKSQLYVSFIDLADEIQKFIPLLAGVIGGEEYIDAVYVSSDEAKKTIEKMRGRDAIKLSPEQCEDAKKTAKNMNFD